MKFSFVFKLVFCFLFSFNSLQSQTTISAEALQEDYQILEKSSSETKLKGDELQILKGKWAGKLTYLNYGDDKTLVDIPCAFEAVKKGKKVATKVVYDELDKNGNPMMAKNIFDIKKRGKLLQLNGKWNIVKVEKTGNELLIVGERSGTDNHRNADFRLTVRIQEGETASWKKEVRYEGTNEFFMRNVFNFKRTK